MSFLLPIVSWADGTNIYEVNIRQYTPEGTINAFSEHVERLADMGIKVLWLMPLTPISLIERKGTMGSYYAASSYVDIDEFYGRPQDLKNLVKKAHALGMKVMIDWVANHTGYDHVWTTQYPGFYVKDAAGNFTARHQWKDVIDLDYTNPEMRQKMMSSMQFWVTEYDLDGFRCDMARTVPLDFWLEARAACDAVKPLLWLAECEIYKYHEAFDLTYGWKAMRTLDKYFLTNEPGLEVIKGILKRYLAYPPGAKKLLFSSNHDENTYHGTEYEKYGVAALAVAVFTCTWPGIPLIYSGQEMPNKRRLSFFEKDEIYWTGNFGLHEFYKVLLNLRLQNKALQDGASTEFLSVSQADILAYTCIHKQHQIIVFLNFGKKESSFEFFHENISGLFHEVFTLESFVFTKTMSVLLTAGGYKVYSKTGGNEE